MTTTKPPRPASKADMRPFYTRKIFELLTEHGKLTRGQIADALGVHKKTLVVYMRRLREDGIVRRNGYMKSAPLWELGEEKVAPKKIGKRVEDMHELRGTVPAQQVGMSRHWMDVALFGPAQVSTI